MAACRQVQRNIAENGFPKYEPATLFYSLDNFLQDREKTRKCGKAFLSLKGNGMGEVVLGACAL